MRDHNTTELPDIPPPPPPPPHRRPRWWRRNRAWLVPVAVVVSLLLVVTAVLGLWRTDQVAVRPGSVEGVPSRVSVTGAEVYQPAGEIGLVTVRVSQRLSILQRIVAEFESGVDIEAERTFTGDGTRSELRRLNELRMENSQHVAIVVALEHLEYEIPRIASGVIVAEAMDGTPAAQVLERGDVIVGIEGVAVADLGDLAGVLAERVAGQSVELRVEPAEGGDTEAAVVELVDAEDGSDRALIGVAARERVDIGELPVDVEIDSGSIGGPSAGLALTLGVIDLLTPGELTGDRRVAATGTIALDGTVGAIGEVDQKAIAAQRAGVDLLLVPVSNVADAVDHAGDDLRVVGVATLQDALDALATA
ncbi:PDZ domain-containing protein [Candidatus Poriferisocius sp.]|uniref:YlbL family protein n=1 Tax=Candidatus Poriferisocius sp. TaxID=3101276 RepID=UPI003B5CDD37